ncbi:WD40 repeat-like protein [Tilletiaria anomala UBC 951]|uniref:WD40 repeat-like protein n=1 Tax=Tilletiaria anomala (strain ATCC 24038 / CBS 436.72 / UBC 951) TaxID=1037660 RepID=A0A066V7M0_TILAU|nr:WD40 repeat-like protein [Tilletiaria anomala UBC 951]KDN37456.1 WD40 repeat-like protein [Tilletiaria anomala UBC 951]
MYREMSSLHGHARGITSLAFSPDGGRLASSGADTLIKVWSIRTGAVMHSLEGHTKGVNEVAWSKDGDYIGSVSDDRTLKIWNSHTGKLVKSLKGHTSYVLCLAFNPQGTLIATGGFDESLKFWESKRGHINAHTEAVSSVDFNRDGNIAVTGSYDGLIRLWDVSSGQCLKTLESKLAGSPVNNAISSVLFSPSSVQLLASSLDNMVRLWDVPNGRVLKTYTGHKCEKHIMKAAFTHPRFIRPGPATAEEIHLPEETQLEENDKESIIQRTLAVERRRRDRKGLPEILVVCGSEDQKVVLWDLQTKEVVQKLEAHRDTVLALAVHPFLPIIASGSMEHDPTIRLWLDVSEDLE